MQHPDPQEGGLGAQAWDVPNLKQSYVLQFGDQFAGQEA